MMDEEKATPAAVLEYRELQRKRFQQRSADLAERQKRDAIERDWTFAVRLQVGDF